MKEINEMNHKEINERNFNKDNSSFEEWYAALQRYAEILGDDWERSLVTDCGESCWKEFYNDGYGIKRALIEGFEE